MGQLLKNVLLGIITAVFVAMAIILAAASHNEATSAESPTPVPTPVITPTPEPERYTLTFVGDNTIANCNLNTHFDSVVKGDMRYCYKNVKRFFADDDMTLGNLECILTDRALYSDSMFNFKAPAGNVRMLTDAGFDFMTCANNHTGDFGSAGIEDTRKTLTDAGIAHGFDSECVLFETGSGLKIGVYCAFQSYQLNPEKASETVERLRGMGAEFVIFALHWGNEGVYHPTAYQTQLAHSYIDAGCDIVYGSHPHVLQPVEEYGNGLIMYSMGNFCFGGNSGPRDMDSGIVRVYLEREPDGTLSISEHELIPCRISSIDTSNDYCPTPYDSGNDEYARTLSKLDGSFSGPDIIPDYSSLKKNKDKSKDKAEKSTPEPPDNSE